MPAGTSVGLTAGWTSPGAGAATGNETNVSTLHALTAKGGDHCLEGGRVI